MAYEYRSDAPSSPDVDANGNFVRPRQGLANHGGPDSSDAAEEHLAGWMRDNGLAGKEDPNRTWPPTRLNANQESPEESQRQWDTWQGSPYRPANQSSDQSGSPDWPHSGDPRSTWPGQGATAESQSRAGRAESKAAGSRLNSRQYAENNGQTEGGASPSQARKPFRFLSRMKDRYYPNEEVSPKTPDTSIETPPVNQSAGESLPNQTAEQPQTSNSTSGQEDDRPINRAPGARTSNPRTIGPRTAAQTAGRVQQMNRLDDVSDEQAAQWQAERLRNSRTEDEVANDSLETASQLAEAVKAGDLPYFASAFPEYHQLLDVMGINEEDLRQYNNFVDQLRRNSVDDIVDTWHNGIAANPRFASSRGVAPMQWQDIEARLASIEKVADAWKELKNNPERASRGAEQQVLKDAKDIYEALGDDETRGRVAEELREVMEQNGWDAGSPQLTARVATRFNLPVAEAKRLTQTLLRQFTGENKLAVPQDNRLAGGDRETIEGIYRELTIDPEFSGKLDELESLIDKYRLAGASVNKYHTASEDHLEKVVAQLAGYGDSTDQQLRVYIGQLLQHWGGAGDRDHAVLRTGQDLDSLIYNLRVSVGESTVDSADTHARKASAPTGPAAGAAPSGSRPVFGAAKKVSFGGLHEKPATGERMVSMDDAVQRIVEAFQSRVVQREARAKIPEAWLGEFISSLGNDEKIIELLTTLEADDRNEAVVRGIKALLDDVAEAIGAGSATEAETGTEAPEKVTATKSFDLETSNTILEDLDSMPADKRAERMSEILDKMPGNDLQKDWTALSVCYGYLHQKIGAEIGGELDNRILAGMAERLQPELAKVPEAKRIRSIGTERLRDLLDKIGLQETISVLGSPEDLAKKLTEYISTHPEEQVSAEEQVRNERLAEEQKEIQHLQHSLGVVVSALWQELTPQEKNYKLRSFLETKGTLSSREGYTAYIDSKRRDLTDYYSKRSPNHLKPAIEIERQIVSEMEELKDALVHVINERNPGRAGEVMLRAEIEARDRNDFIAVPGVTEGGRGEFELDMDMLKDVPTFNKEMVDEYVKMRGRFDEKKILTESIEKLMELPENAPPQDVQRVLNELHQTRIRYENAAGGNVSKRQYGRLKNGIVIEIVRDNMGKDHLGMANGKEVKAPDVIVADKEMGRMNLESFDGNQLLNDRLGFGDGLKLTIELSNGEIMQIRKDKKGWVWEKPPEGKGGPVVQPISEGEVASLVAHVGESFQIAGKTTEPIVYITLNYGELSRSMAKNKEVARAAQGVLRQRNARIDSLEEPLKQQRLKYRPVRSWLAGK